MLTFCILLFALCSPFFHIQVKLKWNMWSAKSYNWKGKQRSVSLSAVKAQAAKCGFHHINISLFCHPAGNQLFSINGSPLQSKICYTCFDIGKYGLSFKLGGHYVVLERTTKKDSIIIFIYNFFHNWIKNLFSEKNENTVWS